MKKRSILSVWGTLVAVVIAARAFVGCGGPTCTEGGKTYLDGDNWECSDGCNSCGCRDGKILSTLVACVDPGATGGSAGASTGGAAGGNTGGTAGESAGGAAGDSAESGGAGGISASGGAGGSSN
jgi:hypothetical protein